MPSSKKKQTKSSTALIASSQPSPHSTSSTSIPKSSVLPRTKYFSIVPLHLLFTFFAIHLLPSQSLGPRTRLRQGEDGVRQSSRWRFQDEPIDWFGALVDQPYQSLALINLALLLVQVWFASSLRSWRRNSMISGRGQSKSTLESRKRPNSFELIQQIVSDAKARKFDPTVRRTLIGALIPIQDALFITFISSFVIHGLVILIGAPIFTNALKTFLLSALVAILAVFPSALVVGWNQGREKSTWVRIFSEFEPKNDLEIVLMCPALGTCVGAWAGGIPIPLDWDRVWQTWPVTCVFGASIGHFLGTLTAMILVGLRPMP